MLERHEHSEQDICI